MNLGFGMGFGNVRSGGAVVSSGIEGIKITITTSNWFNMRDFAIETNGTGLDVLPSLTAVSEGGRNIVDSFDDLAPGQYGTLSDYDNGDSGWNNTKWDDGDNSTLESSHWNDSSGADVTVFVKFASAITSLDKVKFYFGSSSATGVSFEDQDGNVLTPTSSPANIGSTQEKIWEF